MSDNDKKEERKDDARFVTVRRRPRAKPAAPEKASRMILGIMDDGQSEPKDKFAAGVRDAVAEIMRKVEARRAACQWTVVVFNAAMEPKIRLAVDSRPEVHHGSNGVVEIRFVSRGSAETSSIYLPPGDRFMFENVSTAVGAEVKQ
jgi:hypothetical protein